MKSNRINHLYNVYGDRSPRKLDSDDQDEILDALSLVEKINNSHDAKCFLKLLSLVRQAEVSSMKGLAHERKRALETITKAFSASDEGVYAGDSDAMNARFIYELVQNVDDCKYEDINDCKLNIQFDLSKSTMRLEYNELGFQPQNIIAITGLGDSTKNHQKVTNMMNESMLDQNDLHEIGEKGIGFKSIFGLTKCVKITSGFFCFIIKRENFFVPIADENFDSYINGTILELELDNGMALELYEFLQSKYNNVDAIINENPILFLNKLTEIKYSKSDGDYFGFRVSRNKTNDDYSEEDINIEFISSDINNNKVITANKYTHNIEYTVEECRDRYGIEEISPRKHQIIVVAPKDASLIKQGRLYSFFATIEEINAPIIIHAPFNLSSGRTKIDSQSQSRVSNNKWFRRTLNEMIGMVQYAYERIAKVQGARIRHYIPKDGLFNPKCVVNCTELNRKSIINWNIFETVNNDYLPATKVCTLNYSSLKSDLIKIHSILGIEKKLLNVGAEETRFFSDLGIERIDEIEKKLLKHALLYRENVSDCLFYLKEYEPSFKICEVSSSLIILSYEQALAISEYELLSNWLNQQTFDYILRKPNSGPAIDVNIQSVEADKSFLLDFCKEYEDHLNKQYLLYVRGVKYYKENVKNTIFTCFSILGNNLIDDFADAYQFVDKKDRLLYSFLKIESISLEIDELSKGNTNLSDYEFLKRLRQYRNSQKKVLGNQYADILELIEKSGTRGSRFILELLQNIDDCKYDEKPSVTIMTKKKDRGYRLCIEYNETGFTREQIRAITAFGDSTKKALFSEHATGEKGIGFKSIFAMCSKVKIVSGEFSFELSADKPTIPNQIEKIEKAKGTKMIFSLKNEFADSIISVLNNEVLLKQYCLCLKQLNSFNINNNHLKREDDENRRYLTYNDSKSEFFKYEKTVIISKKAFEQRVHTKNVTELQYIRYYIPINEHFDKHYLYSTLPTLEELKIPMFIDLSLDLDTARERVRGSLWNEELIRHMKNGLLDVYLAVRGLYKEKLPLLFPREKTILNTFYGECAELLNRIANAQLFKLSLVNDYVSLKQGYFTCDFEYMMLNKYSSYLNRSEYSTILAKDKACYDILKDLYGFSVRDRTFIQICDITNKLMNCDSKSQILNDSKFLGALYEFLAYSSDRTDLCNKFIKEWSIIPILYQNETIYVPYSKEIYSPGEVNLNSEQYKILNTRRMSVDIFIAIYKNINGSYTPLQAFNKDVIISEFFEKICRTLEIDNLENRSLELLSLFNTENELFKETLLTRKDLPIERFSFINRRGDSILEKNSFVSNEKNTQGCINEILVRSDFNSLANAVKIPSIAQLNSYEYIPFNIGRKELSELKNNRLLERKDELFTSIYKNSPRFPELNDGIGFFELYEVTPTKVRTQLAQPNKEITLDCNIIKLFSTFINEISVVEMPVSFAIKEELMLFEKDHILSEIEDELQIRKETEKIRTIIEMLNNCYSANLSKREVCCVRTRKCRLLLVDSRITSEYDTIDTLKAYYLKYFNTELSVNRNIRLYDRRGFENISTIESTNDVVNLAENILARTNFNSIEEIKDFVCKPLTIKGKTYGGYAKCCPLCNTRIETELTGFRIYKTKCNGMIIPIISCTNCHENLRYASSVDIDTKKVKKGLLDMSCNINGYVWNVKDIVIRLGHRALIKKMNKKKI